MRLDTRSTRERTMPNIMAAGLAALLIASAMPASNIAQVASGTTSSDSAAIANAVDRFHNALAAGDSATAAGLLHVDAVVLESGTLEARAEYLRHHLPADIAFARAVVTSRRLHRLTQRGDTAWAASTSRTTGTFEGNPVSSDGAELVVLHRTPAGWRIVSIHWSSRRHRS